MIRKFTLFRHVGLVLVASISCAPPPELVVPRQVVNARLRDACPGQTDADIEAIIIVVEADLVRGFTKQRVLEKVTEDCLARELTEDDATEDCITCSTIIVDEVYGP